MGFGPPIVATPNFSDPATIVSSSGWDLQAFASNLQSMQPTDRAQSTAIAGGVSVTFDYGSAGFPINLASMLFGNVTETGSWRFRAAETEAELATNPKIDNAYGWGAALRFQGGDQAASASNAAWNSLTSFSVSARVRPDRLKAQGIFRFAPTSGDYAMLGMYEDGRLRFLRLPGEEVDIASPALALDEFARVTVTYDAGTDIAALLVNGVEVASVSSITAFLASPEVIEIAPSYGGNRFEGTIDDVRLYNYARTAGDELAELYAELDGTDPGLVGYWKLNEKDGTTASNEVTGPSLTTTGTPSPIWTFPQSYWASPNLDSYPKRHSLYFNPNAAPWCRFAQIEVIDPANPDAFLHFGRAYVSAAHQLSSGVRYESVLLGWKNESQRTQMRGGPTMIRRVPESAPVMRLRFYSQSREEMYFDLDNVARLRGRARDVLWILEPYDPQFAHRTMIYGIDDPEGAPQILPDLWEHSHLIEGLV